MTSSAVPAAFLDRDSTLIVDRGYTGDPEAVELLAGVVEALKSLLRSGFKLVIITNQSAIGRGIVSEAQVQAVNQRVTQLLENEGAPIHAVYYCPHRPDDDCACRKPAPGLLFQAAEDLALSLPDSIMIGDKMSDVEAGIAAGCRMSILLSDDPDAGADRKASNLADAVRLVLSTHEA